MSAKSLAVIVAIAASSCGGSGRYREISNSHLDCGEAPPIGCGITILDTATGVTFEHIRGGWWEDNPHDGKSLFHAEDDSRAFKPK
jgi:hypothetical protein